MISERKIFKLEPPGGALCATLCFLVFGLLSNQAQADACDSDNEISVHCGAAPSATFDGEGRLWVTFVQDMHVYVSHSDDNGASYSAPVQVNARAEDTEFNGENRPKIIVADDGTLLLSWTLKTSPSFTGEIRFARSTDGGRSFEPVRTLNDDELFAGHRFESMFLTESGHLYVAWIDKRDLEAALSAAAPYVGAAVYYTVSDDLGETFSSNYRVANYSCECCRIAMAPRGEDRLAIFWRQIFGEDIRDHAVAILDPNGNVTGVNRATFDDWHIDACPHHGPDMVIGADPDNYHLTWFSNGDNNQGIYYSRYSLAAGKTSLEYRVDGTPGAGHANLARHEGELYLVWKGFDGRNSTLNLMTSEDEGQSWSSVRTLYNTGAASDHPLLIQHKDGLYLSWHTQELGYVFQEVGDAS